MVGLTQLNGATAGVNESKASLFASRGFLTLNLTYLPPVDAGIPEYFELHQFEEILDSFCNYPNVVPGSIGLHAICFGSWIGLLLTCFRCDVVNVAAVSPMSFAHHISFKCHGKVSEKFPIDLSKLIHTKDGIVVRDAYSTETEYNGSHSTFSAITPSEQINCAVLLICGTDDQYLNVEFNARQIYGRMNKVGKGQLCNILRYPGAGHVIEPPYTPLCYSQFEPLSRDAYHNPHIVWGGESKAHAQAQEDSWSNILAFLRKNIAQRINRSIFVLLIKKNDGSYHKD